MVLGCFFLSDLEESGLIAFGSFWPLRNVPGNDDIDSSFFK